MKYLSNLVKSAKIILAEADLMKGFKLSIAVTTLFYLGADSLYINAVVGIHSALFLTGFYFA